MNKLIKKIKDDLFEIERQIHQEAELNLTEEEKNVEDKLLELLSAKNKKELTDDDMNLLWENILSSSLPSDLNVRVEEIIKNHSPNKRNISEIKFKKDFPFLRAPIVSVAFRSNGEVDKSEQKTASDSIDRFKKKLKKKGD